MINIETKNGTTNIVAKGDIVTLSADCAMILRELARLPLKADLEDSIVEMYNKWLVDDLNKAIQETK